MTLFEVLTNSFRKSLEEQLPLVAKKLDVPHEKLYNAFFRNDMEMPGLEDHDSESVESKPLSTETKEPAKKRTKAAHTCEYTKKTEKGSKGELCGKGASHQVEGKWYCGTMKDGVATVHLKSAMNALNKKEIEKKKNDAIENHDRVFEKKIPPTPKVNEQVSTLLNKVLETKKLKLTAINGHQVDLTTRIVIDSQSRMAIGQLDKDDKTLNALSDENVAFLESLNIAIKPFEKKVTEKKHAETKSVTSTKMQPTKASAPVSKVQPKVKAEEDQEEDEDELTLEE